jgi:hypothetical protein
MTSEDAEALAEIQERSYARAGPSIRKSYPRSRAMDGLRLAAFLDGRRYAIVATSRPDGRPQAAPVAFIVWKGAFWFASVRGARLRNLLARPYASVVIMEGEGLSHRAVIAEGPVVLHEIRDETSVADEFRRRWSSQHGSVPVWAAATIELHPDRLFSYDAAVQIPQG